MDFFLQHNRWGSTDNIVEAKGKRQGERSGTRYEKGNANKKDEDPKTGLPNRMTKKKFLPHERGGKNVVPKN